MKTETNLSTTYTLAFEVGCFRAVLEGVMRCENPHAAGTEEAKGWDDGWLLAHNMDPFEDPIEGSLRAQYSAVEWQH